MIVEAVSYEGYGYDARILDRGSKKRLLDLWDDILDAKAAMRMIYNKLPKAETK
jgi:hypothetical protein